MKLHVLPLVLASLGASAAGQWAPPLAGSAAPIRVEGALAVHDDGSSYQAFSPVAKTWLAAAPTSATLEGTGDWTALFRLDDGTFVAYSARLHATAAGPDGDAIDVRVEDDVASVLVSGGNGFELWGYSAQTNGWDQHLFTTFPTIASSRFVVVAKEDASGEIAGFGARFGTWNVTLLGACEPPLADGNVGALVHHSPDGDVAFAFSGVTNLWSGTSSPVDTSTFPLAIDHDVALVDLEQPGLYRACAYSAYSSEWVASATASAESDVEDVVLRDKVVLVERAVAPHFEAIGAEPHLAWASLSGAGWTELGLSEDAALVHDGAGVMRGFSGLVPGGWIAAAYAGTATFEGTPEHGAVVSDSADAFHAFSPIDAAFASTTVPGGTVHVGDCVAVVDDGAGGAEAWSARHGAWVPAPGLSSGLDAFYRAQGSIVLREARDTSAGDTDHVVAFDERYGFWGAPSPTPGPSVIGTDLGRNAALIHDGAAHIGYSVQRDDATPSPAVGGLAASFVEEDVIVLRDGSGDLHAFGAPMQTHSVYDYPLGTEAQAFSSPTFGGQVMRASVETPDPGAPVFYQVAFGPHPGIFVLGGCLALSGGILPTALMGTAPASGVTTFELALPPGSGPVRLWGQGVWLDLLTATLQTSDCRAEPVEIL